jgi:hypothetical protein
VVDINRVGFLIGVLALVLAVPLSIAANLLTPRIQNWWSRRSQRALKSRIAQLQETLKKSESAWTFTPAELEIRRLVTKLHSAVFFAVHTIFGLLGYLIIVFNKQLAVMTPSGHSTVILILSFPIVGLVLNFHFQRSKVEATRESLYLHTEKGRAELREQIKALQSRLQ